MDGKGQEAARFYCKVFPGSKIKEDSGLVVRFELNGQELMILNGGPDFRLNEAFSLVITCRDQKEIDYYYDTLSGGGEEQMCGWLKDKFGLSWQVVPAILPELMANPERSPKVVEAFMKMKKFDIAALIEASKE